MNNGLYNEGDNSMENRRQFPRKTLIHHLSVTDPETGQVIGFLENISLGGLMVLSQDPVTIGSETPKTVELVLPTDDSGGGSIELNIHSAWKLKDDNANLHATGLKLVDAQKPTLEQIDNLLDNLGSNID